MSLSSFACLSSPSPLPLSPTNRYLLPNGMVLLITELPQHPLISLDLFVHSGSVRDPLPGTSHFLEHLVFAQRTQSSHAHQSSFQDLGGIASASTWYDYSHYSQTLSSESLIPALEGLFPKDPQALIHNTSHFLKEKKIFHLELKQRHDQPELAFIETLLAETLQDTAYHSPHAGMFEGISQLQEHQVNSFYQEWYQPHQMILSASGDLSFEKLQPLLQNYLPAHSSSLLPPKKAPPPPLPRHRPGFRYHLESHPDFSLGLGLLLPGYCHPDRFPLKIAERYISAFLNEYLLNDFRHETRVDVRSYYMESAGVLTIRASGGSPLWVSKELFQGLKALRKKNTFSQESLEQIQRILSLEHLLQQEDIQEVTFRVGEAELFGDYRHFTSFQEQLFAVQVADIERVLKAYLSSNNISLRIKAPSPDLPALQELLEALEKKHRSWRSPRPPPASVLHFPSHDEKAVLRLLSPFYQDWKTPQGSRVVLQQKPWSSLTTIACFTPALPSFSPLLCTALEKYTFQHPTLRHAVNRVGGHFFFGTSPDFLWGMATIRPEDTRQTLEILEKTFSALTLEQGKGEGEEFFEKAKLTEKQEKKPLEVQGIQRLKSLLFPDHPYKQSVQENSKISYNEFEAFAQKTLNPSQRLWVAIGNIDEKAFLALFQKAKTPPFSTLLSSSLLAPPPPLVSLSSSWIEESSSFQQSLIALAVPSCPFGHTDHLPLLFLQYVLSRRLFLKLVQEKAWAYETKALGEFYREGGFLGVLVFTDPRTEALAKMEVLAIISTLIQEPVSLQEIQQAYSYVSTSQKVHYRTSKQLAEGLGTLLLLAKEPFPDLLKISLSPEQLLGYAQQYWGQALIQLILKGNPS